jgi:site-specific DNA-methyltransferase (adenine-specific)
MQLHALVCGDAVEVLAGMGSESVHCIVTSPPYFDQRSYLPDGSPMKPHEIGLKGSPYVEQLVAVFSEAKRVLRRDGTMWLNIGDVYGEGKSLMGMPWKVATALQDSGWNLRQDIIWAKKTPMPESVTDRCTRSHEYVFLMTRGETYFFDAEAIKEPCDASPSGKNRRSVWRLGSTPYRGAHFATMPTSLAELCIKAGTSESGCCIECGGPLVRVIEKTPIKRRRPNDYTKRTGQSGTGNSCSNTVAGVVTSTTGWRFGCKCDRKEASPCVVLDPFAGSGTTLAVATSLGRRSVGIDLNPEYILLAEKRVEESTRVNRKESTCC